MTFSLLTITQPSPQLTESILVVLEGGAAHDAAIRENATRRDARVRVADALARFNKSFQNSQSSRFYYYLVRYDPGI